VIASLAKADFQYILAKLQAKVWGRTEDEETGRLYYF
jgi:hypothetical protein